MELNIYKDDLAECFEEFKMSRLTYNIYGSADSTDVDVAIFLNRLPVLTEDRKRLGSMIKEHLNCGWNIILAKVENGIIADCTAPKASLDSLNNAIFNTYKFHFEYQVGPCEVKQPVDRNKILAIYKTVRILGTYLTRTEYRTSIRPTMHFSFSLKEKIENLLRVNINKVTSFNQPNVSDQDVWKTWAFYVVQNIALIQNIEIYTKADAVAFMPYIKPFIYREELNDHHKAWFWDVLVAGYLRGVRLMDITQEGEIMSLNGESANIRKEWPLENKQIIKE